MKEWTDEVDAEADVFFDTLTTPEIRHRQNLCNQQTTMAYKQGNENALADLQRMGDALMRAMLRRT